MILAIIEKEYQRICKLQETDPDKANEQFVHLRDVLDDLIKKTIRSVNPEEMKKATCMISNEFPLNNN